MSLAPKAAKRIQKELTEFKASPPPFVPKIAIDEQDIRHIYFLIEGPDDSPFKGGEYVLRMELPNDYPMSAPVMRMMTPSGRFEVDKSICTTFTHYHPESWSPSYNFSNILVSFVSFMLEKVERSTGAHSIGSMYATPDEQAQLAAESKSYNKTKGFSRKFDN
jgi:ubiquitin-conjugating enzyme E2 J2